MSCLYVKLSNQLVACSRRNLTKGGKLWDQNPQSCVDNMNEVCKMYDTYLEQYEVVSQKNMLSADKEQDGIELDETVVFGKIELFIKRVEKCIEIFTTVGQFTSVAKNAIEGMEPCTAKFASIVEDPPCLDSISLDITSFPCQPSAISALWLSLPLTPTRDPRTCAASRTISWISIRPLSSATIWNSSPPSTSLK